MKLRILRIASICLLAGTSIVADNYLIFTLRHLPYSLTREVSQQFKQEEGQSLAHISLDTLAKTLRPSLSGYKAEYGGVASYSSPDGILEFTLQHSAPVVYLVITKDIDLIRVKSNTMGKESLRKLPVAYYKFELHDIAAPESNTQDADTTSSPTTKLDHYWQVTKLERPEDGHLDRTAVILFEDPRNIYIEEKNSLISHTTGHLMVPPLYVINYSAQAALNSLRNNNFVRQTTDTVTTDKQDPNIGITLPNTNN